MARIKWVIILSVIFYYPDAKSVEEPKYIEEISYKDFEIRNYPLMLVAQTEVSESFDDAGSKAFRVLADFIFGKNMSKAKIDMTSPVIQQPVSQKIAMTAPVIQTVSGKGYVIQFTMPSSYTRETLPGPLDPKIRILEIPPRKVAVYSYSGSWSEERFKAKLGMFKDALAREQIVTEGEPIFARFNSPWQLWFLRRNEIWLEVVGDNLRPTP